MHPSGKCHFTIVYELWLCCNDQVESWCTKSGVLCVTGTWQFGSDATSASHVSVAASGCGPGTSHRAARRPAAGVQSVGTGLRRASTRRLQAPGNVVQRVWSVVRQKSTARASQDWYRTQEGAHDVLLVVVTIVMMMMTIRLLPTTKRRGSVSVTSVCLYVVCMSVGSKALT